MIIFGGTFDPMHIGHIEIIKALKAGYPDQEIMVVPCYRNPLKESRRTNWEQRLKMVELTRLRYDMFSVGRFEIENKYVYTYQTVEYLSGRRDLSFALGADSFNILYKWKNYQYLIEKLKFIVVRRESQPLRPLNGARFEVLKMPFINISSSTIRSLISSGRSIKGLVTKEVECFITLSQ